MGLAVEGGVKDDASGHVRDAGLSVRAIVCPDITIRVIVPVFVKLPAAAEVDAMAIVAALIQVCATQIEFHV